MINRLPRPGRISPGKRRNPCAPQGLVYPRGYRQPLHYEIAHEPTFEDLLNDPITKAVMNSDKIRREEMVRLARGARKTLLSGG